MGVISNFKALPIGDVRVLVVLAAILGLLLGLIPAQRTHAFSSCLTSLSKICKINTPEDKCLGVEGASRSDGAYVKAYPCSTLGDHMNWIINHKGDGWYEFKNAYSGRCLYVSGGATGNNVLVVQSSQTCSTWSRQFRFHTIPENPTWAWIVPRHSSYGGNDQVLDVRWDNHLIQYQRVLPYHWDQQFRY